MAIVHLARQPGLHRLVAVKELGAFDHPDPELALRFVREARVAGSLSHPSLVTVFDFFEHQGRPYIAMEHLPGGSLRAHMRELTLAQIAGVLEAVLAGLAHAESRGVVHRDLKPENLLISSEGRVKIADFGIAKALEQLPGMTAFQTQSGMMIGTPAYMAPEQVQGGDIGPWTDLYAVGLIAYELLTHVRPFADTTAPLALMYRHANEPIPPADSVNHGIDPRISHWVDKLLVKDRAGRPTSAIIAWQALEDVLADLLGPLWRRAALVGGKVAEASEASSEAVIPPETAPGAAGNSPAAATVPAPGPATPPPADLPPGPLASIALDVPTGPPTPVPERQTSPQSLNRSQPDVTKRQTSSARHSRGRIYMLVVAGAVTAVIIAGVIAASGSAPSRHSAYRQLLAGVPATVRDTCTQNDESSMDPGAAGFIVEASCSSPTHKPVLYDLFITEDRARAEVQNREGSLQLCEQLDPVFGDYQGDLHCFPGSSGTRIYWHQFGTRIAAELKGSGHDWELLQP
jgi:serine/threonine protein kinase